MAPVIGYFRVRGVGEPIILTLKQAKAAYNLRIYKLGDAPDYDKSEWLNEKYKLGLDFPNVPYYIDGDIKITQSLAILRHVGRVNDLAPRTELETIRSDIFEQGAFEILDSCWPTWYAKSDQEFEERRPGLVSYLVEKLTHTSNALGSNKFVLGDRVTYVDFLLYSTLDYIRLFKPSLLDPHANLKQFLDRIEALPEINKYLKSEDYYRFPITGTMSKWGNAKSHEPY
ncbi:glutathione S-transferase Mu 1 [Tetranychus urticae]|uniref:glutathione transferase n=1 Tax=Tetranychus urticae TaxID=32264 RepID=T1K572_TETUR|nr:glutathione S-transferase Mu 1 [Tetranychus urticae]